MICNNKNIIQPIKSPVYERWNATDKVALQMETKNEKIIIEAMLCIKIFFKCILPKNTKLSQCIESFRCNMVRPRGLEPRAYRLKGGCSTN